MSVDWFVILAPVLLVPIVALFRFVGCYNPRDLTFGSVAFDSVAVNCGGPHDFDGGVTFLRDDGGDPDTSIETFESIGGSPLKLTGSIPVTDANGNNAATVYGTCRTGADIVYTFSLATGGYRIILRFAEIGDAQNPGDRVFSFTIKNGAGATFNLSDGSNSAYDIVAKAGGRLISHDEQVDVLLTSGLGHLLTIHFQAGSGSDPNALINAIECIPIQSVSITPGVVPIIENGVQQFTAVASWDPAAAITWTVSGPGQITPEGLFTAPAGIAVKTSSQVLATALFNGQPVTGTAAVSIYPHRDAATRGNWLGKYGNDGYILANAPQDPPHTKLPSYAGQFAATRLDGTILDVFTFLGSGGDPRSLLEFDGTPRATIVWDDPSSLPPNGMPGFILSFDLDSQPRLFGLYCADFDAAIPARDQTITVLNADTQAVIAQDQVQAFTQGVYLLWVFSGRIQIQVKPNTRNAVVSAIFFG